MRQRLHALLWDIRARLARPVETKATLCLNRSCDGGCGTRRAVAWHVLPGYRIYCPACVRNHTVPLGYAMRSFIITAGV